MNEIQQLLNAVKKAQDDYRAACRRELYGYGGIRRYSQEQEARVRAMLRAERDQALDGIAAKARELFEERQRAYELAEELPPSAVLSAGERAEAAEDILPWAETDLASLDDRAVESRLRGLREGSASTPQKFAYWQVASRRARETATRQAQGAGPQASEGGARSVAYSAVLQQLEEDLVGPERQRRVAAAQEQLDKANALLDKLWLIKRDADSVTSHYANRYYHKPESPVTDPYAFSTRTIARSGSSEDQE